MNHYIFIMEGLHIKLMLGAFSFYGPMPIYSQVRHFTHRDIYESYSMRSHLPYHCYRRQI